MFRLRNWLVSMLAMAMLLTACSAGAQIPNTGATQPAEMMATEASAMAMTPAPELMATEMGSMPAASPQAMTGTMMASETPMAPMATDSMMVPVTAMATEAMTGSMMGSATPMATEAMMATPAMSDTMMATGTPMMPAGTMTPGEMMPDGSMPAFFSAVLINVADQQPFKLEDFKGKVVLVETLAARCSACLSQQKQVEALFQKLNHRADLVLVGLEVDPKAEAAKLQQYVQANGLSGYFAIAPADVARLIGQLYGDQFLSMTSTGIFVVDRHGVVHPLPLGVKSAESLEQALEPYLNDKM